MGHLALRGGKSRRTPDAMSRLKFFNDGGRLSADTMFCLTVRYVHVSMHNGQSTPGNDGAPAVPGTDVQMDPVIDDWCRTLIVNGKKCSLRMVQKLGPHIHR